MKKYTQTFEKLDLSKVEFVLETNTYEYEDGTTEVIKYVLVELKESDDE